MHSGDISIENLSKVEGHANLNIKIRNKKVERVQFQITEDKRFFEQAARGKTVDAAPQLMSRICGTCSIAHLLCCIESLEKALGIVPTEQDLLLKKLTMYGMMIRDHALHLYLFSLPDVFEKDSILDFDENNALEHQLLHDAFAVKKAGNDLSVLTAGKAVHAPLPRVGGFIKVPQKEQTKQVIAGLKAIRPRVLKLIEIYGEWGEAFRRKTNFVALVTKDYSFLSGEICSSTGRCLQEEYYPDHLEKIIIPYSTAPAYKFEKANFMVGSLARLNLGKGHLHKKTRRDTKKYLQKFPSYNIFENNLAQAIEILHSIDHSIEILSTTEFSPEQRQKIVFRKGLGVGVIEAPRGTLYYRTRLNASGVISDATVVVPTAQNQANIENDIKVLVEHLIDYPKKDIVYQIEKLVRAYDPCMSCASHFLKVKWM